MILRCGDSHSQCLSSRQTLGWPHQFLEHKRCCQSQISALLSSASARQQILCSWNSLSTQAGRIHLQSVTGPLRMSVSHSPPCLFSAQVPLSVLKQTAKALLPFSSTPTALAATEDHYCRKHVHFLYSVASPENLGWHCWFWCSMREELLLGELHWITARTFSWLSGFCLSNTRYNLHGCSSKIEFHSSWSLEAGKREKWQAQHFWVFALLQNRLSISNPRLKASLPLNSEFLQFLIVVTDTKKRHSNVPERYPDFSSFLFVEK